MLLVVGLLGGRLSCDLAGCASTSPSLCLLIFLLSVFSYSPSFLSICGLIGLELYDWILLAGVIDAAGFASRVSKKERGQKRQGEGEKGVGRGKQIPYN